MCLCPCLFRLFLFSQRATFISNEVRNTKVFMTFGCLISSFPFSLPSSSSVNFLFSHSGTHGRKALDKLIAEAVDELRAETRAESSTLDGKLSNLAASTSEAQVR